MIKFPSIEQFRSAIRAVQNRTRYAGKDENGDPIYNNKELPILQYRGTVKIHGTNASFVKHFDTDTFTFQSRERELELTSDNAGFMLYMSNHFDIMEDMTERMCQAMALSDDVRPRELAVYGEWCGQGIQKGVAVSEVPKMFVIFGVKALWNDDQESNSWWPLEALKDIEYPEARIFNILRFGEWNVDIDFNRPELVNNKLGEITQAVEDECPVGKHFGVSGVGEGVVWSCVTPGWRSSDYQFKVKGEKHSVSKVKTLAPIDVEAAKSIHDFVDRVVTEARLEQGLDNLQREQQLPFEMKSMGDFIRWVFNDVMKEEHDTIVESQLDPKKLGGPIANKARPWFIDRFNRKEH